MTTVSRLPEPLLPEAQVLNRRAKALRAEALLSTDPAEIIRKHRHANDLVRKASDLTKALRGRI